MSPERWWDILMGLEKPLQLLLWPLSQVVSVLMVSRAVSIVDIPRSQVTLRLRLWGWIGSKKEMRKEETS